MLLTMTTLHKNEHKEDFVTSSEKTSLGKRSEKSQSCGIDFRAFIGPSKKVIYESKMLNSFITRRIAYHLIPRFQIMEY